MRRKILIVLLILMISATLYQIITLFSGCGRAVAEETHLDSVPVAGVLDVASIIREKEREYTVPEERGVVSVDIFNDGETVSDDRETKDIEISGFAVLYLKNITDRDVIFHVYGNGMVGEFDSIEIEPNGSAMFNPSLYIEEKDSTIVIEQVMTNGTVEAVRIINLHCKE